MGKPLWPARRRYGWLTRAGERFWSVPIRPPMSVRSSSQTVGHRITGIRTVENLAAMEVDPMAAARRLTAIACSILFVN
ncbi:hypothetical protein [Klebsiella quasipneumoniae]|uniref:hypothetical protein n=1 Tax=Klebsiella quasipneumoniae TaxID=1463165 RepID=UPI00389055D4